MSEIAEQSVLTQEQFDSLYGSRYVDLTVWGRLRRRWKESSGGSRGKSCLKRLQRMVPAIQWLRDYKVRSEAVPDIVAGFTIGIMNIPQGMAYGMLAGLEPVYGLYTSLFPTLIYALLGTSRHVSFGTFAVVSIMVASAVDGVASASDSATLLNRTAVSSQFFDCLGAQLSSSLDPALALEIAISLTLVVGLVQVLLGVLNLGFLAVYLSDQMVQGLTTGAALHVLTSQVSHLTGIQGLPRSSEPLGLVKYYVCLAMRLPEIHWPTVVFSVCCILILVLTKECIEPRTRPILKFPLPIELILVIASTALSGQLEFEEKFSVDVVGDIPTGMEAPRLPNLEWVPALLPEAFTIGIVIFSIDVSVAKLFAKKHDYKIDANQEWFALGLAHVISCFFSCHCSGSSLSRSMVQSTQGGKSQMVSVLASFIILLVLLVMASLFQPLPKCALAAIIVVSLKGLFLQLRNLPSTYRKSPLDFLIWVVTFLAVVLLNLSLGLAVGIAFALLTVVFRSQWPDSICLGRVGATASYKGINAYEAAHEIPGIKIYRFDSPLYFANAELFTAELHKSTGIDPVEARKRVAVKKTSVKVEVEDGKRSLAPGPGVGEGGENELSVVLVSGGESGLETQTQRIPVPGLQAVILDCSSFSYVDVMGVEALTQVFDDYDALSIPVFFVCCKVAVRQMLERAGFYERVPRRFLLVSVHDAVLSAQQLYRAPEQ